MYIFISILISLFSFIHIKKRKIGPNNAYLFIWLLLTIMLSLRYGQGTDYYGYYLQFDSIDTSLGYFTNALYHGELGWYMLLLFFKKCGFTFELFICLLSVVMMIFLHRSFKRISYYPLFSILLFYPTYYLTYCYSAMRQGLVLCLFLAFGLNILLDRKYKYYLIFCLFLCFLHTSSILLMVMPLIINIKIRFPFVALLLACSGSLALSKASFMLELSNMFTDGGYMDENYSIGAIAMRFILFYIIYRLHTMYRNNDEIENRLYNLYAWGCLIFMALSFSGTLSQRLTVPFKALEVILIPYLLYKVNIKVSYSVKAFIIPCVSFLILLMNIELYKNLNSYIEQGNYYSWVSPITYPYISVFNENDIWHYITHFDE